MTVGSLLDPGELQKEKEVIVNEIRSVEDSPEEMGHDRYLREMWGDHPLARKITGEVEEVRATTREQLAAFAAERLVPGNTIIAVAGNFEPAEARDLALRVFPSAQSGGPRPRTPPEWNGRTAFVADRFNQVQIYAGTSFSVDHQVSTYYTSLVFSTAFGESMSSRLFQRLREELALCYTVYSFRTFFSDLGMWTIYANTTPGQTRRFLASLDEELARLLREPLQQREIEDATSHLVGSMILSREDMETRMKRLVRQHLMMDRILSFDESVAALRSVTAPDVDRHARQCLRGDLFSLLAYGSRGLEKLRGFDFSFSDGASRRSRRR
jgi:predicted Zn-dependent peptidase